MLILLHFCKGLCCSLRIMVFSLLGLPNRKLTCHALNLNFTILQLLEAIVKNCGDIVHMHVAEKGLLHQMVKMVKKKVIADSEPPLCYFWILPLHKVHASILYCFANAARLSCQGKDISFNWHLARSFWRTKGEIPSILWSLPRVVGESEMLFFLLFYYVFIWSYFSSLLGVGIFWVYVTSHLAPAIEVQFLNLSPEQKLYKQ